MKMKLKKIEVGLLTLAICAVLMACDSDTSPESAAPVSDSKDAASDSSAAAKDVPEENLENANTDTGESGSVMQPEGYPDKAIDLLIPAPAGAAMDLAARALESAVNLGTKSISITNMAGASNTIGTAEAFSRDADGYTILMANLSAQICQPLRGNADYTLDDFRHIAYVENPEQMVLVANKDCGITSFEDLIEALSSDQEVFFTCANAGAVAHLAMLTICDQLELPVPTYVSYSGAAEVVSAVLGGQVDIAMTDVTVAKEYCLAGEMTALLTISDDVCSRMPDVPHAGSKGLENMDFFTSPLWVAVKADTPDEIVAWITQQINEAILSEEYQNFLATSNLEPYTDLLTEEEITQTLHGIQEAYAELYGKYF